MEDNRNRCELMEQLRRVQRLMHRYQMRRYMDRGPMGDPNRGQGRVLSLLKLRPEISQRELLYLLDMRPQSLGELLAKLEKAGYVERSQSEADRRAVTVRLTEAGAAAAEQAASPDDGDDPLNCLERGEQAALAGYLNRVGDALERALGDDGRYPEFCGGSGRRGAPGERGRCDGPFGGRGPWERGPGGGGRSGNPYRAHHGDPHRGDPHRDVGRCRRGRFGGDQG